MNDRACAQTAETAAGVLDSLFLGRWSVLAVALTFEFLTRSRMSCWVCCASLKCLLR